MKHLYIIVSLFLCLHANAQFGFGSFYKVPIFGVNGTNGTVSTPCPNTFYWTLNDNGTNKVDSNHGLGINSGVIPPLPSGIYGAGYTLILTNYGSSGLKGPDYIGLNPSSPNILQYNPAVYGSGVSWWFWFKEAVNSTTNATYFTFSYTGYNTTNNSLGQALQWFWTPRPPYDMEIVIDGAAATTTVGTTNGIDLTDHAWHFFAVTWKPGNDAKLYMDGTNLLSMAVPDTWVYSDFGQLNYHIATSGVHDDLAGIIDEVGYTLGYALTDSDIQNLYNGTFAFSGNHDGVTWEKGVNSILPNTCTICEPNYFYWTLDETNKDFRLDSSIGLVWNPFFNATNATPGLFGNAVKLDCKPTEGGLNLPILPDLGIGNTDTGASLWYWLQLKQGPSGAPNATVFNTWWDYTDPDSGLIQINWVPSGHGVVFTHQDDNTGVTETSPGLPFTPGTNEWHMLGIVWDKNASRLRCYIDGNNVSNLVDNVTHPNLRLGQFSAYNQGGTLGGDTFVYNIDEVGLSVKKALSDANMLAIWNSGFGATWPTITGLIPEPVCVNAFAGAQVFLTSEYGVATTGNVLATDGQTAVTWTNQVPTNQGDAVSGVGTYHTTGGPNGYPYISITNDLWNSRAAAGSSDYLINGPFTAFLVVRVVGYDNSGSSVSLLNGLNDQIQIFNDGFFAGGTFGLADAFFDVSSNPTVIKAGTSATGVNSGIALNQWYLMTSIVSNSPNTYVEFRTNGVSVGSSGSAVVVPNFDWQNLSSPSFAFITNDYAAFIVIPTNYPPDILQSVEASLKHKYGIP